MQNLPHIEIINLGDELLLGLRDNSHLTYLTKKLCALGLPVARNLVIRDAPSEIKDCFTEVWERSDIVITTGGLGPTCDDNTREAIAACLGIPLQHNSKVEDSIKKHFEHRGLEMLQNNLCQAQVLEGAEALPNKRGTAPGLWLNHAQKLLIMLPGPSSELHPMVEEEVVPRLRQADWVAQEPAYLSFRVMGQGESQIATTLQKLFDAQGSKLQVAYCAHNGIVDIRLSGLSRVTIEGIAEDARSLLGQDFIGFGECRLEELILGQLRTLNQHLALAESCTGGLLASKITDITGASDVFVGSAVCYTEVAKVTQLKVPREVIRTQGAVSGECAAAMASGAASHFRTAYALSTTGFLGPTGGKEAPVGTVFLGCCSPQGVTTLRLSLKGDRITMKERAANAALDWLRRQLMEAEWAL